MFEKTLNLITANLGTKLISVVIAIVLWVIVLGSRSVEVTKEIPLHVVTATDTVPSNEIPEKIAFRLTGPEAFLRAVLDRHFEPIQVNLSGAKAGVVTYRFFNDNIKVPIGVRVLAINPPSIVIKLENMKHRDIPVKASIRGTPQEGFRIGKMEVKPEIVRVRGAESRIDALTEVQTNPIDVNGAHQSIEKEASLDLSHYGVQLESAIPKVFVDVEALSANYRIKNVDIRVLSPYKVRLEEKSVTVLVRAESKEVKGMDRSQVYAIVDLTGKPRGHYAKQPVRVTLPEDVGLVKVIPDSVSVTLY